MKQPSKTNYSIAGIEAANTYGLSTLAEEVNSKLNISNSKVKGGIMKPVSREGDHDLTKQISSMTLDTTKRPITDASIPTKDTSSVMSGGKKQKSKRMKSRYRKKYKVKRTNRTRKYRK